MIFPVGSHHLLTKMFISLRMLITPLLWIAQICLSTEFPWAEIQRYCTGTRWGIVCMLCTAALRRSACLRGGWSKRCDPEDFKWCAQDVHHSNLLYHSGLLVSCIDPNPSRSSFEVMAGHNLGKHLLWEVYWNDLQSSYCRQFRLIPAAPSLQFSEGCWCSPTKSGPRVLGMGVGGGGSSLGLYLSPVGSSGCSLFYLLFSLLLTS